jgi:SAM-dependent methyltransferase
VKGAIACSSCQTTYDVIYATPFLGHYEALDIIGLFEIAANAREDNSYATRLDMERLDSLLHRYDESHDKPAFASTCDDDFARAAWFQNRYTEYTQFKSLARGVRFVDREVLDVGAGTGHDACRLLRLGARVTALEHNPMLIRRGRSVVPEARWIGGFSHALPFENETFDIVCCNAALHHMRDIPAAVQEMLRVLRSGGWLLTSGDPFRPDHAGDEHELDVFDRHPAVLLGVNESIPTLEELVATFVSHRDRLDVELHAPAVIKPGGRARRLTTRLFGKETWQLDEREGLADAGGAVAMKARVKRRLPVGPRMQAVTILRAGDYAEVLSDYDASLATLVPLLADSFVDMPFPGDRQTKFELLNGWQHPRAGEPHRTGYRRARWFLTRPDDADTLRFSVASTKRGVDSSVIVRIDGVSAVNDRLRSGQWLEVNAVLADVPTTTRFVCEIEVVPADAVDAQFDDYCFAVKDRRFA